MSARTPRTPREHHEEQGHLPAVGDDFPVPPPPQEAHVAGVLIDQMVLAGLHLHMDSIVARIQDLATRLEGPVHTEVGQETFKVNRRRSLDEMEAALRRLMSPEPRPADDDSPQVLRDTIHEAITLRQIMNEMMQASMNVYHRGLSSIRAMTEK